MRRSEPNQDNPGEPSHQELNFISSGHGGIEHESFGNAAPEVLCQRVRHQIFEALVKHRTERLLLDFGVRKLEAVHLEVESYLERTLRMIARLPRGGDVTIALLATQALAFVDPLGDERLSALAGGDEGEVRRFAERELVEQFSGQRMTALAKELQQSIPARAQLIEMLEQRPFFRRSRLLDHQKGEQDLIVQMLAVIDASPRIWQGILTKATQLACDRAHSSGLQMSCQEAYECYQNAVRSTFPSPGDFYEFRLGTIETAAKHFVLSANLFREMQTNLFRSTPSRQLMITLLDKLARHVRQMSRQEKRAIRDEVTALYRIQP